MGRAEGVDAAFDRLGARAWTLAMHITGDKQLAADIVVGAFRHAPEVSAHDDADARLLCDLRHTAIAAVSRRSPTYRQNDAAAGATIAALPEQQRTVLELALFGRLSATQIAGATALPRPEVITLLADAMRMVLPAVQLSPAVVESSAPPLSTTPGLGALSSDSIAITVANGTSLSEPSV